jgi:hypothetical protein
MARSLLCQKTSKLPRFLQGTLQHQSVCAEAKNYADLMAKANVVWPCSPFAIVRAIRPVLIFLAR